ncbi:Ig-like domain-containing protein [Flavisolibacter nicotianae]|uniref:Ig-like domain-containing protein n=1 Tax=Flavisolibacter nicotianae TaxID=2364882 RepID=UPI00196939C0|nr:Ig-like domain-containing protein [Flavisolibacter nicotianae]
MRLIIPTLCFLLLCSCNKSGREDETAPPPVATTTLTLNVAEATPGDAVEIKGNKTAPASEMTISIGSSTVKGYAKGDSAYVFIVPVVSPGTVQVSLPSIPGSNNMSLKIATYTPVSDPQVVISDFIDKRNKSIDSVANPPSVSGFQPSPATVTLLNQLKEEMDLQLAKLSASEKELLSYVLQKNKPDPVAFSQDLLAPSFYAKQSDVKGDVGDRLVAIAKTYVTVQGVCLSTIPIMVASGVAVLAAPNPFAAAVFIGSFTTFVISREHAIRRAQEVGRLKGVAEVIMEGDAQKPMVVGFTNNQEKTLSLSVNFRNLATTDAGINADVTTAFSSEQSFVNKDKEMESLYGKIKTSAWFTKLSAAYTAYVSVIGKVPQGTTTLPIDGNNIVVKGVSDSRINYSTSLSGTSRKIKISSVATGEISFALTLGYKRTLDGKEITKDIACLYKPVQPGSITAVSGSGQVGAANTLLANPLVVLVKDENGQPMQGVTVKWAVSSGGGQVGASSTTNANGQASTNWTLGASGPQTVTATVTKSDGTQVTGSPLTFTAAIDCDPSSPNAPVINGITITCNANGHFVFQVSFTAPGSGAVIGSGFGACDESQTCYPTRLYFLNPGAPNFTIAANSYSASLKSGTVNSGVIEIDLGKNCVSGKTAAESLQLYYTDYRWRFQLMNKCNQRSGIVEY